MDLHTALLYNLGYLFMKLFKEASKTHTKEGITANKIILKQGMWFKNKTAVF